jgi:hypothetical protein
MQVPIINENKELTNKLVVQVNSKIINIFATIKIL